MKPEEIIQGIRDKELSYGEVDNMSLIYWLGKITKAGSLLLGIAVCVTIIAVPLNISIEMAYINIQLLRRSIDNTIEKNGKSAVVFAFICRDARKAIENYETGMTSNVNLNYCYIKCKSFVMIALLLSLILEGTSVVITKSYGLVGGVIEALKNIGF